MECQFRSKDFHPSDPITIILFLPDFLLECDPNHGQEGITVSMFQSFLNMPESTDLHGRVDAKHSL